MYNFFIKLILFFSTETIAASSRYLPNAFSCLVNGLKLWFISMLLGTRSPIRYCTLMRYVMTTGFLKAITLLLSSCIASSTKLFRLLSVRSLSFIRNFVNVFILFLCTVSRAFLICLLLNPSINGSPFLSRLFRSFPNIQLWYLTRRPISLFAIFFGRPNFLYTSFIAPLRDLPAASVFSCFQCLKIYLTGLMFTYIRYFYPSTSRSISFSYV